MVISSKKFIGLGVETKSGQILGSITGFDMDIENFRVTRFYVKPSGIVSGLVKKELIIGYELVISITEEKMIVEDLMEKQLVAEGAPVV